MKDMLVRCCLLLVALCGAHSVSAMPITNGNFDAGLDGWADASGNGSVSAQDGHAVLSTGPGDDLYSSILVQGDDGWFSFEDPLLLPDDTLSINFDAWLYGMDEDPTETGGSFYDDSFSLAVYDASDSMNDRYFLDIPFDSAVNQFTYDISDLSGRSVAFSFELTDENDGWDLSLGLDNIFLGTTGGVEVAEPSSLVLMILGALALAGIRFRAGSRRSTL